jgi:Na+/H+ antiporter NhaD/arsenite permease-like protein
MDIIGFVKKDYLLVISAVLALISLFLVPFDTVKSYNYERILETICTLLFFLLIVAGLKECNALNRLAQKAITSINTTRALCLVLILLPFFCAMLFSNDVSLLTFVPLAIAILAMAGLKNRIIMVVILQTVAANVGSYLTPFGNPHNLYIYNLNDVYGFSLMEYEMMLIPIVAVGAIALLTMTLTIKKEPLEVRMEEDTELKDRKTLIVLAALFVLAIVTVVDVIPFYITLAIIILAFLVMMPRAFLKVNYSILFIFFFLFIFANGLTSMEEVHNFIRDLMDWDPMITTVLVSQFTSNVPSTILLQPFTDDWAAVLVGADIGGFGTPIASMASIISLKLYLQEEDSSVKDYLKVFFTINLIMLAVLIPTYYIFD